MTTEIALRHIFGYITIRDLPPTIEGNVFTPRFVVVHVDGDGNRREGPISYGPSITNWQVVAGSLFKPVRT